MKTNYRGVIRQLKKEPATPHCADFLTSLCKLADEMAAALKMAQADEEEAWRDHAGALQSETKEAIQKALAKFEQI